MISHVCEEGQHRCPVIEFILLSDTLSVFSLQDYQRSRSHGKKNSGLPIIIESKGKSTLYGLRQRYECLTKPII